jgi:hypothetical protein
MDLETSMSLLSIRSAVCWFRGLHWSLCILVNFLLLIWQTQGYWSTLTQCKKLKLMVGFGVFKIHLDIQTLFFVLLTSKSNLVLKNST